MDVFLVSVGFFQCDRKSIFSDPQKKINSDGKIYLGSKIKMSLKCCISVHPAMDNEDQK